ncbi:MAG: DUF393 domain-containing protein [Pseudomonadota bacterium]
MTKPTVFYNGSCPVCRTEIEHYRDIDAAQGEAIEFRDINADQGLLEAIGLDRETASRRLYVQGADGALLAGIPAFALIWEKLPRYRWLAKLSRLPVLRTVLPWLYEPVAFVIYRWDQRRRARLAR